MSRELLLHRLNSQPESFHDYLQSLFLIYRDLNNRRSQLSPEISELAVFGGALYYVLVREAELLGIIEDDIDLDIYHNFKKRKTLDLDVYGYFENSLHYKENSDDFDGDAEIVKKNFYQTMFEVSQSSSRAFDQIKTILNKSKESFSFGLDCLIQKDDILECRPQIKVCSDKNKEHILEVLIQAYDSPSETVYYDLVHLRHPFLGKSIMESVTEQIYPNERAWNEIDQKESAQNIFRQMKDIFDRDQGYLIHFKQGYYRTYMIYYILLKAEKFSIRHLLRIIIPTNEFLRVKLFFFQYKNY